MTGIIIGSTLLGALVLIFLITSAISRKQKLKRALLLKERGNVWGAIAELSKIIEEDPSNEVAHWYLALFYEEVGDFARAAETYKKMLDAGLLPEDITLGDIHRRYARALIKAKDGETAYKELMILHQVEPGDPEVNFLLGLIYATQGLFDDAIKRLRRAIEIKRNMAEAHFYLALCYAVKGEWKQAAAAIRHAVSMAPDKPIYLFHLAGFLFQAGAYKAAAEHARRVIPKLGDIKLKAQAIDLLALSLIAGGRYPEAEKVLSEALKNLSFPVDMHLLKVDMTYNLGVAQALQRKFTEAIKSFKAVYGMDPGFREISRMPMNPAEVIPQDVEKVWRTTLEQVPIDFYGTQFLSILPKFDISQAEKESRKATETPKIKGVRDFLEMPTHEFINISQTMLGLLGYTIVQIIRDKTNIDHVEGEGIDFLVVPAKNKKSRGYVFVRRWKPPQVVGELPIKDLVTKMHEKKCEFGIFLSTVDFSPTAKEMASTANIHLVGPTKLATLFNRALLARK